MHVGAASFRCGSWRRTISRLPQRRLGKWSEEWFTYAVEFAILGPLEARAGDDQLAIGGSKQRAVLAILLLEPNRPVSRDRLIDGVWGEAPPPTASHALDDSISRLR